jgi:hypothetical protein
MRRLIAAALILVAAGVTLRATLTIPADFRTVVNDASLIVRGRVTDVRSVETPGIGVESVATIAVENVLKGHATGFVYVRVPGGIIGNRRYSTVGSPAFRVGQRAVLFLRPSPTDSSYRPIGLTMGVYPIQTNPATGKVTIVEPPILAGTTTNASGVVVRGDRRRVPSTVPEFESFVRLAMATPSGNAVPRGAGGK